MTKNEIFDRVMMILDFYISIGVVTEEEIEVIHDLEKEFYEAKE